MSCVLVLVSYICIRFDTYTKTTTFLMQRNYYSSSRRLLWIETVFFFLKNQLDR